MMNDEAVRRLQMAELHDHEGAQARDPIRYDQGEDGWMAIRLGGWSLDYLDVEAPLILKQNGAEILLYESDIDTLIELLQRAKCNVREGS